MRPVLIRLGVFALLAGFANLLWFTLLAEPPLGRAAAVTAIAVTLAALLVAIGRIGLTPARATSGRAACWALAAAGAVLALAAGLAAAGLPLRYLPPAQWDELGAKLDPALARINEIELPYAGGAEWVELAILLLAPLLTWLAAVLAFWPARRGENRRQLLALISLVLLYGIAVGWDSRPGELGLGLGLFALTAAWLWGSRLRTLRGAAGALAVVGLAAVLAVPAAARLDPGRPWWDYRDWDLFGSGHAVSFDWTHSYGPIDWPREGTVLMEVESENPRYWKTEVLDTFDGRRWMRGAPGTSAGGTAPWESAFSRQGNGDAEGNRQWFEKATITIRSLRTVFVPAPGTLIATTGVAVGIPGPDGSVGPLPGADGTTAAGGPPLPGGWSYSVLSYVPDPSPARMRAAPAAYGPEVQPYTQLGMPLPGAGTLGTDEGSGGSPIAILSIPPWGSGERPGPLTRRVISGGPYRAVYALAERLTAGAATPYDAVRAIGAYLQRGFRYDERPGVHRYPLAAFLATDRSGYCQHFSGAMTLLLRMVGIPSRVVSGFAPGSPSDDGTSFRVTDFDAHSWVEVYFDGIGWVVFDPTPGSAPPPTQPAGTEAAGRGAPNEGGKGSPSKKGALPPAAGTGPESGGASPVGAIALGLGVALIAAGGCYGALVFRRRRRLAAGVSAEAQLAEVASALPRLGIRPAPGSTLLALERRLARTTGREAGPYLAGLREHRFGAAAGPPGPTARRAFRRALASSRGWGARLMGYRVIPPGGPVSGPNRRRGDGRGRRRWASRPPRSSTRA